MSLIQIKPFVDLSYSCPCSKAVVPVSNLLITGMHCVCTFECPQCGEKYWAEAPINAGAFYPGIIHEKTGARKDKLPFDNWYLHGFAASFQAQHAQEIGFQVEKNRDLQPGKKTAILHCLDSTYGHALFELFNADYYLNRKDIDLIILVQKNMRWLVPEGAAEVWVVDLPFSRANDWNNWLARCIESEIKRLPEQVFLCRTFVQADSRDFDIERYSRVKPFPLEEWNERLIKPTVTFIWRADRFWKRSLPRWADNRLTRKLVPGLLNRLRKNRQTNWVLRFAESLRQAIPNLDFAIAGMDERDPILPDWIKDFRYPNHADETARLQCRRYAESHLILGCNGSSLILPGCHSGAMLDIVPGDQWAVSAGSFAFRHTDLGDTHYRYTMVPAEISIHRLTVIVVAMLRDRAYIQLQTSPPWRDHEADLSPFAISEHRVMAFNLDQHFNLQAGQVTIKRKQ